MANLKEDLYAKVLTKIQNQEGENRQSIEEIINEFIAKVKDSGDAQENKADQPSSGGEREENSQEETEEQDEENTEEQADEEEQQEQEEEEEEEIKESSKADREEAFRLEKEALRAPFKDLMNNYKKKIENR